MAKFNCDLCKEAQDGILYQVTIGCQEFMEGKSTDRVTGLLQVCERCKEKHVDELLGAISTIQEEIPPVDKGKE